MVHFKGRLYSSLDAAGDWVKKRIVLHSVRGPLLIPRVLARMRAGRAQL